MLKILLIGRYKPVVQIGAGPELRVLVSIKRTEVRVAIERKNIEKIVSENDPARWQLWRFSEYAAVISV